jgi:hypothetical protein
LFCVLSRQIKDLTVFPYFACGQANDRLTGW